MRILGLLGVQLALSEPIEEPSDCQGRDHDEHEYFVEHGASLAILQQGTAMLLQSPAKVNMKVAEGPVISFPPNQTADNRFPTTDSLDPPLASFLVLVKVERFAVSVPGQTALSGDRIEYGIGQNHQDRRCPGRESSGGIKI